MIEIKCKGGKYHWWPAGWICEKCGLTRHDYEEEKKRRKEVIEKDESYSKAEDK